MRDFNNILYASHGISDEKEGLIQALSLAHYNKATLKILILIPDFPDSLSDYRAEFENSILSKINQTIEDAKNILQLNEANITIDITLEKDVTPAVTIIQHVLRNNNNLVIKEATTNEDEKGFEAIDMHLLRKCPAPVWLCRPISKTKDKVKVAVAIDPEDIDESSKLLSERLLQLSSSLSDNCDKELHIISCWDCELETTLKNNSFIKLPEAEVDRQVNQIKDNHFKKLQEVITSSKINENYVTHHLRGKPQDIIPKFMNENNINIIVMGTVARTGIAGFLIGNTSENIIQKLSCSLLALKPRGFVSPIQAFS